jgi:ABC-type glycerol-3-phosphate transport system substrate-binding protein
LKYLTGQALKITIRKQAAMVLLSLLLITAVSACGGSAATSGSGQPLPSSGLPGSPAAIKFWQGQFPDDKYILSVSGDVNADNRADTMIVYSVPDGHCELLAVLDLTDGYHLSGTIPAPMEKQKLSFLDFDSKPPTEILISGENGSAVGLGIFRLENNEFVNVFGEDYSACCGI